MIISRSRSIEHLFYEQHCGLPAAKNVPRLRNSSTAWNQPPPRISKASGIISYMGNIF